METFFILFVLVFVPFGWFIVRALRYTNETVGKDSPLYKERTYQFSVSRYFIGFFKLLMAIVLVEMSVGFMMVIPIAIHQEPLLFFFLLFLAVFIGLLVFFFYFDWQYWTITRNTFITLNPFQPSITVDSPEYTSYLTPDNVAHIEQHLKQSSNSKDILGGYGYYLFYTNDGQITRVNNIFFADIEFLDRFFSTVPQTCVLHRFPWITDLTRRIIP